VARFTVDTYPGQEFEGEVTKVRYNAMMTQNVVTYTVEVTTKNEDLKLLPYLTANVKFIIDEKKDVQLVSNAALRWRPALAHVHPDYRSAYEQSLKRKAVAAETGTKPVGDAAKERQQNRGMVWIEQDGFVRPIKVLTGLTDGVNTEVVSVVDEKDKDLLNVDTPVVVSEVKGGGPASGTVNPFVTPMFGKKKQQ
jgi:HlyD family secretion protein